MAAQLFLKGNLLTAALQPGATKTDMMRDLVAACVFPCLPFMLGFLYTKMRVPSTLAALPSIGTPVLPRTQIIRSAVTTPPRARPAPVDAASPLILADGGTPTGTTTGIVQIGSNDFKTLIQEILATKRPEGAPRAVTDSYEKWMSKHKEAIRAYQYVDPRLLTVSNMRLTRDKLSGRTAPRVLQINGGLQFSSDRQEFQADVVSSSSGMADFHEGFEAIISMILGFESTPGSVSPAARAADMLAWKAGLCAHGLSAQALLHYLLEFMFAHQGVAWAGKLLYLHCMLVLCSSC
jgi:hypothetical protein